MIEVVTSENKHLFSDLLDLMFRQRYQIFVKTLGWTLEHNNCREKDEYDTDEAVYLLASDDRKHLQGAIRLLPTTHPHLLGDHYTDLCECGVPRGPHIWEATRAYSKPAGTEQLSLNKTMGELFCGMLEYALLSEIEKYTLVASLTIMPAVVYAGWDVSPLGIPKIINGDRVGAFCINVSPSGLRNLRFFKGSDSPVISFQRAVPAQKRVPSLEVI